MNNSDPITITTCVSGFAEVWQGRYGWLTILPDQPWRVNSGHRYPTLARAERTIRRMQSKYPRNRYWQAARAHNVDSLWLDSGSSNPAPIAGLEGKNDTLDWSKVVYPAPDDTKEMTLL